MEHGPMTNLTGSKPYVIDRDEEWVLHDRPKCSLAELEAFAEELEKIAGRASDLGLNATWMRLECADDWVCNLVAQMRAAGKDREIGRIND